MTTATAQTWLEAEAILQSGEIGAHLCDDPIHLERFTAELGLAVVGLVKLSGPRP